MRYQGVSHTRHVSMKHFDCEEDCLKEAIRVRDALRQSLTGDPNANLRTLSKVGNSYAKVKPERWTGIKGIRRCGNSFSVTWYEDRQPRSKQFSIRKYGGEHAALEAAIAHRKAMEEPEAILVCVVKDGKTHNRTFNFKHFLSPQDAIDAATQYKHDLKRRLYGCAKFNTKNRNLKGKVGNTRSNLGITGVSECQQVFIRKDGTRYVHFSFRVTWRVNGRQRNKLFSFGNPRSKMTRKEALLKAIEHRAEMEKLHYV